MYKVSAVSVYAFLVVDFFELKLLSKWRKSDQNYVFFDSKFAFF